MSASKIHSSLSARKVRPLTGFDAKQYRDLAQLGIHFSPQVVRDMAQHAAHAALMAGDAAPDLQPTVTTASIGTPVQFLQAWLPGFVEVITTARKADEIIGVDTVGAWEDEEVVQGVLERTGIAVPYGDYTNVPFSSWNTNWERRTVVRFEEGLRVGVLEERRAARQRVNSGQEKRGAAADALEIQRNRVAFYGYNQGLGRTWGILNDPGLPAYVTVANGAAGTPGWNTKTMVEITADFRSAAAALRSQSGDRIDPKTAALTWVVPTNRVDYLTVISEFGYSVMDWLAKNYPNTRIVSAPEFEGANGGVNVFYLFAESYADGSSDGGKTWAAPTPAKFMALGVEKTAKGYVEDYSNATAGALLKRPWAVVRRSGI